MALESGTYIIASKSEDSYVGRKQNEDKSLLPKRVVVLPKGVEAPKVCGSDLFPHNEILSPNCIIVGDRSTPRGQLYLEDWRRLCCRHRRAALCRPYRRAPEGFVEDHPAETPGRGHVHVCLRLMHSAESAANHLVQHRLN